MSTSSAAPFTAWLNERCAFLHNLESEANQALHQENDTPRYRELMQQKAMFLAAIAEGATPHLSCLPEDKARMAAKRLGRFSASAENALSIGSTFYMSALLYPEDYQEGQMNDLQAFCAEVAQW